MLIVVKPGMVLISLTNSSPVVAAEQKVDAREARAVDRLERGDRLAPHVVAPSSSSSARGDLGARSGVDVLRFVVVELARRHDLAGHRRLGRRRCRAPRTSISRASGTAASTTILRSNSAARSMRGGRARPGRAPSRCRRSSPGWRASRTADSCSAASMSRRDAGRRSALPVARGSRPSSPATRRPLRPKQHLHHGLVHADGRGEHAAADVGDIGQLEQALNRAVFAVRAVQHGKDRRRAPRPVSDAAASASSSRADGDRRSTSVSSPGRGGRSTSRAAAQARGVAARLIDDFGGRRRRRRTIGQHPAAVLLDADGDGLVALAIEVGEDGGRRRERHFVLAGSSAVEHADAKTFHADCRDASPQRDGNGESL